MGVYVCVSCFFASEAGERMTRVQLHDRWFDNGRRYGYFTVVRVARVRMWREGDIRGRNGRGETSERERRKLVDIFYLLLNYKKMTRVL